jgi:hypothetical protein
MMASCLSNDNNRMTLLEYVKSLEFNTKLTDEMENLLKPYNDKFAGTEYFILNEGAKGIDIAKAPDKYGKKCTLRSIEYKSDTIVLFRFFDESDNEISLEHEIDMSVSFRKFLKNYYGVLNYDMHTKSWSESWLRGRQNYNVSKSRAYNMKYLNDWYLQIRARSIFSESGIDEFFMIALANFKSYTDSYRNSAYTQSSFERMKNEYTTDMKYHVNYVTSVPMNEITEVGSIYRLQRPVKITNKKVDLNTYVVHEFKEINSNWPYYESWSWSDEYIFVVNDDIDTDELPSVHINRSFTLAQPGKIGYIVRFDGTRQFVLTNGLIRMIPIFTLLGGNKYAYDDRRYN